MRIKLLILFLFPAFVFAQHIRIGQTTLGIVNATDYGIVGDSSTDNTAAFRAAIAATPAGGKLMINKPGVYLVTDTLLISKAITIEGVGGLGNGTVGTIPVHPPVTIGINTPTKNLFVDNVSQCQFKGLGVYNFSATNPTAGKGILFNKGVSMRMENVTVSGFYVNVDIENGYLWKISGCHFQNPIVNNLIIRDVSLKDGGDAVLEDSWFFGGNTDGMDHILYTTGGGLKCSNLKFNTVNTGHNPRTCINAAFTGSTVDLLITNSSFENFTGSAISIIPNSGITFSDIVINGNQISPGGLWTGAGGYSLIQLGNTTNYPSHISISGNSFSNPVYGTFSGSTYSGYSIFSGGDYTTIGPNTFVTLGYPQYDNVYIYRRSNLVFQRPDVPHTIPTSSAVNCLPGLRLKPAD